MKVDRAQLSQAEIKAKAGAWYARQLEVLAACHGSRWPHHRSWLEQYLQEELRQRLLALGWRPKA